MFMVNPKKIRDPEKCVFYLALYKQHFLDYYPNSLLTSFVFQFLEVSDNYDYTISRLKRYSYFFMNFWTKSCFDFLTCCEKEPLI
jgi:hypothetical protein